MRRGRARSPGSGCPGRRNYYHHRPNRILLIGSASGLAAPAERTRGHADDNHAWFDVARDNGSSAGERVPPDRHGRHEHRVASEARAVLDDRPVLCPRFTIEIHGNRASPDIHPFADLGIADVAHVVDTGVSSDPRVLDLRVIAELDARSDLRTRPQVREGANPGPVPDP